MADELIRVQEDYYILATSARVDDRTRVLKQGDTFALSDRFGDMEEIGTGVLGLYHQDTRFLSRLVLRLAGQRPLLLSSTIQDDNAALAVDLMNHDVRHGDEVPIPRGTVHLFRSRLLLAGTCHERLRIHNYGATPIEMPLSIEIGSDFADIFEVRGLKRLARGTQLPAEVTRDALLLSYRGLDGLVRRTRIGFDPVPDQLTESEARYVLRLDPRSEMTCRLVIDCLPNDAPDTVGHAPPARRVTPRPSSYEEAGHEAAEELSRARAEDPEVFTSNEQFNDWLNRSLVDLHMMRTETSRGPYPYAGIPWFSTVFGRDGIITALETLWFNPALARGVLGYLAATQADEVSPEQDAEPGKILHETRSGEVAVLGEIPFGRYYGSVDATPLFVMLAGAYHERTGDLDFARSLWPHVERALEWMRRYGDRDGDGFVEYARRSPHGLVHQGWKDSRDSVFHADGTAAEAPIALCEVQGYAYAALQAAAALAGALAMTARADELRCQAATLRRDFDERFWCEDISTYALALDGEKKACRVRTSNPGHCLFTGIATEEHARRVAATLLADDSFSGWGIRTVSAGEARFNPMSYHNGSVWPHDSAIAAAGFARYGLMTEAARVATGLFDASIFFDLHRLPELFCGFPRRLGQAPTQYPVSCSPQSWAAGAVFFLLRACLGLEVLGSEHKLVLTNALLPDYLDQVEIRGLRVRDATLDLTLTRLGKDVSIHVPRREGHVSVVAVK